MAQHNWYNMKSVPQAAGAASPAKIEMNIFDIIGGWGISASQFIGDFQALRKATGAKEADLYINSPGGSVFEGYAIMNALNAAKEQGLVLNVKIIGIAASMASVVAMAGTTIEMPANTMMMIHNAISGVYGNAEEMRDTAEILDKIDNSIVATYVARTGKTEEDVRAMMAVETFMTAQEALDGGFATAVTDAMKVDAKFDVDLVPEAAKVAYKAAMQFKAKATTKPVAKKVAPVAKTEPEVKDPVVDDEPDEVTATITDMATNAGLTQFIAMWSVQASTIEQAEEIVGAAITVKKLCATAKLDGEAEAFIKAGTPVAEVRTALLAKMNVAGKSVSSAAATTDPKKPQSSGAAQPKALRTTAEIWAARNSLNRQQAS